MKYLVKLNTSRSVAENKDVIERLEFVPNSIAAKKAELLGAKTEVLFELDTETGEFSVKGAAGYYLSEVSYRESRGSGNIIESNENDDGGSIAAKSNKNV